MWYEQLEVMRMPSGFKSFSALRLISLYPLRAPGSALRFLANAGGSRHMRSNVSPALSFSRRKSKALLSMKSTLLNPFSAQLRRASRQGLGGNIHAQNGFAMPSKLERKRSGIRKAIQRPARSVSGCRKAVLPLIEKESGLLSSQQIDHEADPIFAYFNFIGNRSPQNAADFFEAFKAPHPGIVSLQNALWLDGFLQNLDQQRLQGVGAARQSLQDQVVAIPVDDDPGKQVSLPEYQAIGGVRTRQHASAINRRHDTGTKKLRRRRFGIARKEAQPDLRLPAVERISQNIAGGIHYLHNGRIRIRRFTFPFSRINPEMTAADAANGGGCYLRLIA